jgi:hypothetical protein
MRTNLTADPDVKAIARALKLDAFSVVGRLHAVWAWADEHTADGVLPRSTLEDIDEIAGKRGFAAQMVVVDWLAESNGGLVFPGFERHNGTSAKARAVEMDKKRRQRSPDAGGTGGAEAVPEVSRSCPDVTGTEAGLEKRREEIIHSGSGGGSLDSREHGGPSAPPPHHHPSASQLPAAPGTGPRTARRMPRRQDTVLTAEDLPSLEAIWPAVDLSREFAQALAYVQGKRGPGAMVTLHWFSNEWLPNAPVTKTGSRSAVLDTLSKIAPPGWQGWVRAELPEDSAVRLIAIERDDFFALPANVQRRCRTELAKGCLAKESK